MSCLLSEPASERIIVSCKSRKVMHRDKDSARRHLSQLRARVSDRDKAGLDIYFCVHCEHWHVGHKPGSAPRQGRCKEKKVCTWPLCGKLIEPRLWGCHEHWSKLPQRFRQAILATIGSRHPKAVTLGLLAEKEALLWAWENCPPETEAIVVPELIRVIRNRVEHLREVAAR